MCFFFTKLCCTGGNRRGVVAIVLDCDIVVNEFELLSLSDKYPRERGKPLSPPNPSNVLNRITTVLLRG